MPILKGMHNLTVHPGSTLESPGGFKNDCNPGFTIKEAFHMSRQRVASVFSGLQVNRRDSRVVNPWHLPCLCLGAWGPLYGCTVAMVSLQELQLPGQGQGQSHVYLGVPLPSLMPGTKASANVCELLMRELVSEDILVSPSL